jgi:hypothetical protein
MARRLNIGLYQGPPTLVAQPGKYGILHPNLTFSKTGVPVSSTRRYFPDWQTVLEFAQLDAGNGIPGGGTVTGTYPSTSVSGSAVSSANPCTPGVTSIAIYVNWSQLESSTGGTYTSAFTLIDQWITQCRGLSVAAGYPVGLFIIIATRSFGGNGSTAPAYLDAYGEHYTGTSQSGWQVWRWSPFVLQRFQLLCNALGARYDADPNWGGITTQETASGGATGKTPTGLDYTVSLGSLGNYTGNDTLSPDGSSTNQENSVVMEQKIIAAASSRGRGICLVNFIDSTSRGTNNASLTRIAARVQPLGTIWCGPDLVTDLSGSGLLNQAYPSYNSYHNATNGVLVPGLTGCSIQQSEWSGAKGPPQHPPIAGSLGPPAAYKNPSLPDLFNYGTSSKTYAVSPLTGARDHSPTAPISQRSLLNLDLFLVNYVPTANANGDKFSNAAAPIMAVQSGFGTVSPSP